jgi:hypothetical protein
MGNQNKNKENLNSTSKLIEAQRKSSDSTPFRVVPTIVGTGLVGIPLYAILFSNNTREPIKELLMKMNSSTEESISSGAATDVAKILAAAALIILCALVARGIYNAMKPKPELEIVRIEEEQEQAPPAYTPYFSKQ